MVHINIDPVAFSLGPLSVHWYGLMYVVGIAVGLFIAWPYAKWKGVTAAQFEKVVIWSIPMGLIGARLYYDLQQPLGQYLTNPILLISVWNGGMAFYGAIFAVVLTVIILAWRMHISIFAFLDVAVMFAAVGQFFGRIGNIINGDVIGYPTNLPWGFVYSNPNSLAPRHDIAYQPAAVYEAIINIVLFLIMWSIRKKVRAGVVFFIYIFSYSLSQFIVFFWRDNEVIAFGLKQAQITAIAVIIIAAFGLLWFLLKRVSPEPQK